MKRLVLISMLLLGACASQKPIVRDPGPKPPTTNGEKLGSALKQTQKSLDDAVGHAEKIRQLLAQ